MVSKYEAVCLWEDHIGDSGKAPTDDELHEFALAVEARTRQPFITLADQWDKRSDEILEKAEYMESTDSEVTKVTRIIRSQAYSFMASRLRKHLNGE